MMNKILIIVLLIAGAIVLFVAGVRFIAPLLIFFPSKRLEVSPAAINLSFEDITITASDGIRLHGWYIPAENPRATLLFFHGNAGNISHRLESIKIFNELGLSVFIFDYRGYGQSTGRPSVKGVTLDAIAAWNWLTETKQIPAEKIVVFGRSLGGAVAMELTRSVNPGALILESTFSSLADMSPFPASITPFLIGGDFWNSAKTALTLSVPALCIHSPGDEVIPYNQGRRIYDAIPGEKTFLEIRGSHNSGFMQSLETYIPALDRFLGKHFGGYTGN